MENSEKLLRHMLWLRHGCPSAALYGDDGKMDCNSCLIHFATDSVESIQSRFWQLAEQRAQAPMDAETLIAHLKRRIRIGGIGHPQIFGLQVHGISDASGFSKALRTELEGLGFVWNRAHELWMIMRTKGNK